MTPLTKIQPLEAPFSLRWTLALVSNGGGDPSEGEDIAVSELPFAEALAMVSDGRIRDAKTIMLLQHAALHLFAGEG